jgi:hypothetical protein
MNSIKMNKKDDQITVLRLILLCVKFGILSPAEAEVALKTGRLPDSILSRLKIAEMKDKN